MRQTLLEEVNKSSWLDEESLEGVKEKIFMHKLVLPLTFINTSEYGEDFDMVW